MLSNESQISNYDQNGNDPDSWKASANRLISAADILKNERNKYYRKIFSSYTNNSSFQSECMIFRPEIMLRGFAIECLLKALWVKQANILAKDGELLKIENVGNHKLIQLANKVNFIIDEKQKNILKRLEVFIISVGRYPIATRWETTQISKSMGGPATFWGIPTDDELFDSLVSELNNEIEK